MNDESDIANLPPRFVVVALRHGRPTVFGVGRGTDEDADVLDDRAVYAARLQPDCPEADRLLGVELSPEQGARIDAGELDCEILGIEFDENEWKLMRGESRAR